MISRNARALRPGDRDTPEFDVTHLVCFPSLKLLTVIRSIPGAHFILPHPIVFSVTAINNDMAA
jgi:hypothetical protein